jgi:Dual oxidase maturation factor
MEHYPNLFFGAFRSEGFPTAYDENKTAAHVDVLEAGFILAFIILAVAFLIILPAAHRYGVSH